MKRMMIVTMALTGLLLFSASLQAQNRKEEWFGSWAMNHDGHTGTLMIRDSPVDCATTRWCDMNLSYLDNRGARFNGRIESVDTDWRHMVFYITFGTNRQRFDGYLFSWDKTKMAGTTIWNGVTFGFYASRR
jgi:hypothetical protein